MAQAIIIVSFTFIMDTYILTFTTELLRKDIHHHLMIYIYIVHYKVELS